MTGPNYYLTPERLHPAHWRVGDRTWHPDGVRARRTAGLSPLVLITAVKATNRHNTRFRVDWETTEGEKGAMFVTSVQTRHVYRATP